MLTHPNGAHAWHRKGGETPSGLFAGQYKKSEARRLQTSQRKECDSFLLGLPEFETSSEGVGPSAAHTDVAASLLLCDSLSEDDSFVHCASSTCSTCAAGLIRTNTPSAAASAVNVVLLA
mmetsp:Transcript_971/g.1562  ORF Transcript_971/g.1562 Transcript_971/m.1562 type:complete len:120 (+) Transcript_971:132-491(+)